MASYRLSAEVFRQTFPFPVDHLVGMPNAHSSARTFGGLSTGCDTSAGQLCLSSQKHGVFLVHLLSVVYA